MAKKGKLRKFLWPKQASRKALMVCIYGVLAFLILGGIWMVLNPAPATPITTPNAMTFNIVDRWTGEDNGGSITWYGSNIDGMTQAEVDALQGANFTALGTNISGEGFTPDADLFYIGIASCVGYNDVEFELDSSVTGTITVTMLPVGTNASILAISSTLHTNLKDDGINTTANTTETDWTLVVQCLNSTGKMNNSLGFGPFCNFIGGGIDLADFATYTNQLFIDITLNVTADPDWITVGDELDVTVVNSTTHLYLLVNEEVIGRETLSITLDAGIGTTFVVSSAYTRFGSPTGYVGSLGVLA
jgi:hypothetical protein